MATTDLEMTGIERVLKRLLQNRTLSNIFFFGERKFKEWFFDCQSCGNCVLSHTAFVCPMRCPKQQRNGPCGGAMDGYCEVDRKKRCVWDEAWESAHQINRVDSLMGNYEEPLDWRLYSTSAWDNMLEGRLPGPSLFQTMFKKGEPLLVEGPRVTFHLLRNFFKLHFGPSWRRWEGRGQL